MTSVFAGSGPPQIRLRQGSRTWTRCIGAGGSRPVGARGTRPALRSPPTHRQQGGRGTRVAALEQRAPTPGSSESGGGGSKILTLHLSDSTLKLPLDLPHALEMKQATLRVFESFKEKETWERPRKLDSTKLSVSSGTTEIGLLCNPNAYPTAFQAKVLVKMSERASGIELTTEVPLSKFKNDLDDFLKATME
mmetsp:Transcript_9860/g.24594  ORF Transcript_9860/g.24594 Transcript_9860/m.24594 type:complete len:193 (+) Transcript_9860:164-742(+)